MTDTLHELIREAREHMKANVREAEEIQQVRMAMTAAAAVAKLDRALLLIGEPRLAA